MLFFVSVGMLFDPAFRGRAAGGDRARDARSWSVAKPSTAFLHRGAAAPAGAGGADGRGAALSQVGEFSFILATLGLALGLIPDDAFQLVVAAALVSITLNPLLFRLVGPAERWLHEKPGLLRLVQGANAGADPDTGAA